MGNTISLDQIGERNIINNIIMEYFHNIKAQDDDCAIVELVSETLLLTTDPAPRPIAFDLGFYDYYYYGWLTVIVNLSDLASMGAIPRGVLTATVMKPDMLVSDYERFLQGVSDACRMYDCQLLGGNIKDGSDFSSNGFAIGTVDKNGRVLRQGGARPGDRICVIGEMGSFWTSVLWHMKREEALPIGEGEKSILFRALVHPTAKIREGKMLSAVPGVTACTDNSDGITWSFINMARKSNCDFILELDCLPSAGLYFRIASAENYPIENLLLSGGDYQLVCTVDEGHVEEIEQKVRSMRTPFYKIGYVEEGSGVALVKEKETLYYMNDLSSVRFQSHSMFTYGYRQFLQMMKTTDIRGCVYK